MSKKQTIGLGFLILFLVALIAGIYWYNKPHKGVGKKTPDFTTTASELYNAYEANEQAADSNFLNKIITVTGRVEAIDFTSGSAIIQLQAGNGLGGVSCRFMKENSTDELRLLQGKLVKIKGRCSGFLMDVNLVDCVLIQ